MVMKLVRVIMIKLLCNMCTCVYTYDLELPSEYLPACYLDKI